MGTSWQTQDQKDFFNKYLALYVQNSDAGKLKDLFWPTILDKWFEQWPLPEPLSKSVAKEGLAKAEKIWKAKKVEVSIT